MDLDDFYTTIIDLPHLTVTSVEHDINRIDLHCIIEKKEGICPVCHNQSSVLHQYKDRHVRDLSISGKEVWLHIRLRQFYCSNCDSRFIQKLDWLLAGKSYTKRQSKWMFEMCAKQPFTEAGALLNICAKTLENNYYQQAELNLNIKARYAKVRKLGIDEISHGKGKKNYLCVLVDLETGTEIDILSNRKKATLIAHFEKLGDAFCNQIEAVCIDMWTAYKSVVEACFPNAKLVIDRFHVVKALNEVLDETRKDLRREQADKNCFKNIKWALFKRPENCVKKQTDKIQKALEQSWQLNEVYELRNTFNSIFDFYESKHQLDVQLEHWITHAQMVANKHLDKFLQTLKRWKKNIITFAECRISNAATEGRNNFIRYFKRISFGLHNFRNMRLRVLANSN